MRRASSFLGSRGRSRKVAIALVGCLTLACVPAAVQAQVAVQDLEVHIPLGRDTLLRSAVIPVKNEEQRAQQVRVTIGDWTRDSLGNNVFREGATASASCGTRLRVFPTTFQVAPGATELVRVTYAPTALDEGCWAIVFIETVAPPPPRRDGQGSFVTLEIRTGVKIYVHREGATSAGVVEGAEVGMVWRPKTPAGATRDSVHVREAKVLFVNQGTAHLRVKSTMEIRDQQARLLKTVEGPEAPMVPGAARYISLRIPDLGSGDYVAVILLDYGGEEIAAAQIEFRVP